jgi:type III restriction enzyme
VSSIRLQPVAMDILIQHLRTHARERLVSAAGFAEEEHPENYLVRALIDFDDICYDEHADLLYKLTGQVVTHLQSYLLDEDAVTNVLLYHHQQLAELIHAQMQAHHWERATTYETYVSKGFTTLRPNSYSAPAEEGVRNFRAPVEERQYIRGMLFGGFRRCLYPVQKFESDPERRFAVILEDDENVLKWFKPAKGQFQIHYRHNQSYEPDFVVETKDAKFLCEPKRASEIEDDEVQAKACAAVVWCQRATDHEQQYGGKPWHYLLVPHDAITANKTLHGLAAAFTVTGY